MPVPYVIRLIVPPAEGLSTMSVIAPAVTVGGILNQAGVIFRTNPGFRQQDIPRAGSDIAANGIDGDSGIGGASGEQCQRDTGVGEQDPSQVGRDVG